MGDENRRSGGFVWEISNFSKLASGEHTSDVSTVGGCKWKILISTMEGNGGYISIFLCSTGHTCLPVGSSTTVQFCLTVVDQYCWDFSIRKEMCHESRLPSRVGYPLRVPLTDLYDQTRGFLAQDTLVVEAYVTVLKAAPPVIAPHLARATDGFVSYFNSLYELIAAAETSPSREGTSSATQTSHTVPPICPSAEEVENAKEFVKECFSDILELMMDQQLASSLSTLSFAETRLPSEGMKSLLAFWFDCGNFISDYLDFDQDNSEYEQQKAQSDLLLSAMKENREKHLSYIELSEKLASEEEELKKKLEETKRRNAQLISDWEDLISESEETKSKYVSQKEKVAEAEERKKISEARMSQSTTARSAGMLNLFLLGRI